MRLVPPSREVDHGSEKANIRPHLQWAGSLLSIPDKHQRLQTPCCAGLQLAHENAHSCSASSDLVRRWHARNGPRHPGPNLRSRNARLMREAVILHDGGFRVVSVGLVLEMDSISRHPCPLDHGKFVCPAPTTLPTLNNVIISGK